MSQPFSPPCASIARGSLTAVPLSDREWRISDDRMPDDDGRSVIGFAALTVDGYEVVELGDPVSFWTAPTLEAVMDRLVAAASRQPGRVTYLSSYRRRHTGVPYAV